MQQRVDERASRMASSCMYDHACGLVHSNHIVVLVEDFEWKVFGFRFEGREIGGRDRNDLATSQYIRGAHGLVVDENTIAFDPRLEPGAAELRQALAQKSVKPFAGIACFDGNGHG